MKELLVQDSVETEDFGVHILYQWFAGECLNKPVDILIINHRHYVELGGAKIQQLQEFLVKHGAVEYIRIIGDHNVPENLVFTSGVGE
jgi:hypothetical protein